MAATDRIYPQIPTTVWWGLRDQFKRSIPAKVTDAYLAAHMNVQGAAAKTYVAELKRVGLLEADGRPSDLAKRWRLDDKYRQASDEILSLAYPEELLDVALPSEGDRSKALRWFMEAANLGEGAAKNKVGTYFLIGAAAPPDDAQVLKSTSKTKAAKRDVADATQPGKAQTRSVATIASPPPEEKLTNSNYPLNVNVQIHISADASPDQIEAIFANMRKYLQG